MKDVLLITSAQYVLPDMQSEFGKIPPAFLPLGDTCLVKEQLRRLQNIPARRYLTLPENYVTAPWQQELAASLGLTIIPLSSGMSLGDSVVAALGMLPSDSGAVHILHGDTIIDGWACDRADCFSAHPVSEAQMWAKLSPEKSAEPLSRMMFVDDNQTLVMSGYFSFGSAPDLIRSIHHERGNFIAGISRYNAVYPLTSRTDGEWMDFGHLHNFFRAKRSFLSKRAFNTIAFGHGTVVKSGSNSAKIAAEAAWFRDIPASLKIFTPQFIGSYQKEGRPVYELEYLNLCSLSELFVYGDAPMQRWEQIFESCRDFLQTCTAVKPIAPPDLPSLYLPKTLARLEEASRSLGWSLDVSWTFNGRRVGSLRDLANDAASHIARRHTGIGAVMHGDFCFSNILFDSRAERIKVLDPRGFVDAATPTLYGDPMYDVAKLYHSAVGLYDLIIAGVYRCERNGYDLRLRILETPKHAAVADVFRRRVLQATGMDEKAVAGAAVLLFLSMIPLHYDHPARQEAFLANAWRLATLNGIGGRYDDRDTHGGAEQPLLQSGLHATKIHVAGSR